MMNIEQRAARVLIHEIMPRLKRRKLTISQCPISVERLCIGIQALHCGAWDMHHFRQKLDEAFHKNENE